MAEANQNDPTLDTARLRDRPLAGKPNSLTILEPDPKRRGRRWLLSAVIIVTLLVTGLGILMIAVAK